MGYSLKQSSTAQPLLFLMVDSTDHVTGKTGLSPTVTLSKNGAAFASPAGAVTELANGWYKIAGNATDTGTLGPLALHATASGADPVDDMFNVVAFDPQSATGFISSVASVVGNVGGVASGGITAASFATGAIDNAAIATDAIGSAELAASAVTEIQSGLALATDVTVIESAIAAIQAKTVNLPASPAAVGSAMVLTVAERNSVADAMLDRANGIETSITPRQALRLFTAILGGKGTESPTGTYNIYRTDGTTVAITLTHSTDGTRTVVIGTLS